VALLALALSPALAQGGYDLSWFSVDGGGDVSSGGVYTVSGSLGQPDAGLLADGGGQYVLGGGFWGGGALLLEYLIHLPLILR